LVRSDGSADGFSVDLLKAVTQAMGLEINFIVGPWHEIKQKLVDGHLDVLPLVSIRIKSTTGSIRKKNTLKNYEFLFTRFSDEFGDRDLDSITPY